MFQRLRDAGRPAVGALLRWGVYAHTVHAAPSPLNQVVRIGDHRLIGSAYHTGITCVKGDWALLSLKYRTAYEYFLRLQYQMTSFFPCRSSPSSFH